ncbi:MAG: nucleotidyltransferase domain-containing protein [Betaproteobacteria bacterium]|nr:nucleotidyltransferase domain-containing protein [Betaproteobacteria bacterium]
MASVIDGQRDELIGLCRRYGVRRLELFGSATGDAFDPQRSDIDFVVDFDPAGHQDLFHRYFGLNAELERLLGRKVDLVMVGAMRNPYFIESVNRTRQLVYAAPLAQTA